MTSLLNREDFGDFKERSIRRTFKLVISFVDLSPLNYLLNMSQRRREYF
jgi:hypothetical protein